ncbi:DNA primase [Candidatus Binatus sp.]|uniref:DNA primase n=1 Tax=Candidatus Binatus sp. TaxID=2811406 RepID=UPI002F942764
MGRFGDDKIEEVRSRADIVEIVGAHVRLRRAGRNFVGLCPFHNEKTPSFSVNAERGFFHCFGCGAGGSVFNFIMRVEGLTFPEAVRSLARKYGVKLPEHDQSGPAAGEREAMLKASEVAAEFFAHVLWNTTDGALARDYLKSRGISAETARAFMIGFAPSRPASLAKALEKRGLGEAGLKVGLIRKHDSVATDAVVTGAEAYDMFRARVMFPIRDAQGRAIAFGGRVLDARLPKYINSPESPLYSKARTLYGLFEARQAISSSASSGKDRAIIVEGYFDVIVLWQAGFKEAVAGCGTALTVEQLRALSRYTKNVIACFDGDAAGRKASMRALEIFLQAGLLGRGIFIPSGFDPDTFVRERGAVAFAELTDKSELLVDYFLSEQAGEARGSIAERARAANRVAEMLKLVDDPFQFDLLARKAADLLSIGEEVLRKEARGPQSGSMQSRSTLSRFGRDRAATANPPAASGGGDAGSKAEIGLVAIALLHPELRAEIAQSGATANFEEIRLGGVLADLCRTDEAYTALEQWTAERLSAEEQSRISEFAVGPLTDDIGGDTEKNPNELGKCRALVLDYAGALDRRRRAHELGRLRQSAAEVSARESEPGEAAAAAQAVIAHRRQG